MLDLQGENRNLSADMDQLREQLEEEQEGRGDLQRLLTKANGEIQVLEHTYTHTHTHIVNNLISTL